MRVRAANDKPIQRDADYVLYWMIAARRPSWNFALDRAIHHARTLDKPLLVFEPLEVDYPWASDRLHRFVLDGMRDNAAAFARSPIRYFPYVEPTPGAGRGLLAALAKSACVVVTDEFPCFFLPKIVAAAATRLDVLVEAVDSNGLIPLAAADRVFTTAASYRRFVQRNLTEHLATLPSAAPLQDLRIRKCPALPGTIVERWPAATSVLKQSASLSHLPIDHRVPPVSTIGGDAAARASLDSFIERKLKRYGDVHSEPESDGTSRLSPYLHFGHISAHEIFARVMSHEKWSTRRVRNKPASGAREGWWGVSASAERFLDQLTVWRELAYNTCAQRPNDYDRYGSLPDWALETLEKHRGDRRPALYDHATLERGATHDRLWNAAQGQLLAEGWFHNYMRMLWGKKILEWSRTPRQALAAMIGIMNRWSLDGRNPNSYAGYFWTLGRYDRPWPERDVYGVVRSMTSASTARKFSVKRYMDTYAPLAEPAGKLPLE